MQRRQFLSLLGAAVTAPALPLPALGKAPVAASAVGYNRYTYGLAVFQARTRASVSAADLMARLKVNAVQAEALMGEMTAKGVVSPIVDSAVGAMRATVPNAEIQPPDLNKAARKLADWVTEASGETTDVAKGETDDTLVTQLDPSAACAEDRPERSDTEQETTNG